MENISFINKHFGYHFILNDRSFHFTVKYLSSPQNKEINATCGFINPPPPKKNLRAICSKEEGENNSLNPEFNKEYNSLSNSVNRKLNQISG